MFSNLPDIRGVILNRPWIGALWGFGIALTLFRILIAYHVGLAPDEAYYWRWSLDLGWSYPDHPPLVAWLIKLGTTLGGNRSLGVRLPGIFSGVAALYVVYQIAKEVGLDEKTASITAMLSGMLIAPCGAAIIMTPDTPLGLCWLASVWLMVRLRALKQGGVYSWYVLGAVTAIAILSKYSGFLLFVVILMSFVTTDRKKWRWHPYAAVILTLLILVPHLVSEWGRGFVTGQFQGAHLLGQLPFEQGLRIPERFGALISGQFGMLTPLVSVYAVMEMFQKTSSKMRVVALAFGVPIAATAVASLATWPEQNWASLGHPCAAVLAMSAVLRIGDLVKQRHRLWGVIGSVALIFLLVHLHLLRPFLPLPPEKDPTARLHGFEILEKLAPQLAQVDGILCDNYGLAAEVAWHFRGQSDLPAVVGADREKERPEGRLLLLNQHHDVGRAALDVNCSTIHPLFQLPLVIQGRGEWDRIQVFVGESCHSEGNSVVSSHEE